MRFRIASLEWQLAQQIYTPFPRISNAAALPQEELRVGRDLLLLEERLRLMEASTSWRITAPLRFVKRLIGR